MQGVLGYLRTDPLLLDWSGSIFPRGEQGFYRAPVLITGPTEAVLIDCGFTLSDGRALVEAIQASGKRLTSSAASIVLCFSQVSFDSSAG